MLKAKKVWMSVCVCVYLRAHEHVYEGGGLSTNCLPLLSVPSYLFSNIPSSIQAHFEILLRQ